MTFICELNSPLNTNAKKKKDGNKSHNNNIKMELKEKKKH